MAFPVWLKVWYRKPEWRDIRDYTRQLNDESFIPRHRSPTPSPSVMTAIPARLALDKVLENKTCSPMSLHDFYLYLKYMERSAENLEFWLWCVTQRNIPRGMTELTNAANPWHQY